MAEPFQTILIKTRERVRLVTLNLSESLLSIKDAVRGASDLPLQDGLRYERRLFNALLATEDKGEGMSAFLEERAAPFSCY